jgi:hypothetical protein
MIKTEGAKRIYTKVILREKRVTLTGYPAFISGLLLTGSQDLSLLPNIYLLMTGNL